MNTQTNGIILILVSSFVASFGAVFLKLGAEHMRGGLAGLFKNYWLGLGVVLYLFSSVFFLMAVSQGDLTLLYPMVSLGYIWTIVWARIFFKEPFTMGKVAGLAVIVVGVALVNLGAAIK